LLHLNEVNATDNVFAQFTKTSTGTLATNGFRIGLPAGSDNAVLRQQENHDMIFYTNYTIDPTVRMIIKNTGNVGINTTTPNTVGSISQIALEINSGATPN